MVDKKTFLDDRESLNELIERLPEPELSQYKNYGALYLESAFPGRKMVVYTLKHGDPSDREVITFGSLIVDPGTGPSFEVYCRKGVTRVTAVPQRLKEADLFLHVPQTFTFKYKARQDQKQGVDFTAHYAVLIKTRSKELHQVDGHTYCVTLNRFHERFPDLNTRY